MAVGGGRCAAAFLVAEAGVEIGCLEGVGAQGHLVAAAARYLLLGGGEQAGAKAIAERWSDRTQSRSM